MLEEAQQSGKATAVLNKKDEPHKLIKVLLGLIKILGKLPLQKLSARMAYSMAFNLILLLFMLILKATGNQVKEFPNAWDFRFLIFTSVVVFFVGISDIFHNRRR